MWTDPAGVSDFSRGHSVAHSTHLGAPHGSESDSSATRAATAWLSGIRVTAQRTRKNSLWEFRLRTTKTGPDTVTSWGRCSSGKCTLEAPLHSPHPTPPHPTRRPHPRPREKRGPGRLAAGALGWPSQQLQPPPRRPPTCLESPEVHVQAGWPTLEPAEADAHEAETPPAGRQGHSRQRHFLVAGGGPGKASRT
uniref:Uncharacterized protein n=1 Tax=Myotis myotis TaxID=51298 RepID=A0A7J7Z5I9_MYOMY|nr:hypothetical protein mMyoMyo1_010804 [Myotis myotis]